MKQLTCEMCGGTDLVKDGGVFVCQTCGCKYSIEEAKRMMVEGTVEVQGTVHVANSAQISNLLKLAHSAYDSKNYAKAEDFCNQIIAMDDHNSEAWKLKGEAINYQINAKNPRILEVYNCIMTAYRVLDDDMDELEKTLKTFEICSALKTCMEGEVDFWLDQLEAGRPTEAALKKAKNTYVDCYNKMKAAYEEFGYETEVYLKNFDNHFCIKSNSICVAAWKSTVAYNYFRDDLDNLGKNWNRVRGEKEYVRSTSDVYRPSDTIFRTFVDETFVLIGLLKYCTEQFNDLTDPKTKENIYSNIAYYYSVYIKQRGYRAMVSTTTNGYGAEISRREYYVVSRYYDDETKADIRKIVEKYEAKKREAIEEGRKKKIADYWKEHSEEKAELDSQKEKLESKIKTLEQELEAVPGEETVNELQKQVDTLMAEKKALSLFKLQERKELRIRINEWNEKLSTAQKQYDDAKAPILSEIDQLVGEIVKIDNELTKDR